MGAYATKNILKYYKKIKQKKLRLHLDILCTHTKFFEKPIHKKYQFHVESFCEHVELGHVRDKFLSDFLKFQKFIYKKTKNQELMLQVPKHRSFCAEAFTVTCITNIDMCLSKSTITSSGIV
jgi:hypothetical protein